MWMIDKLTQVGQYAWGQANAAYQMLVDATGTPLNTNAGSLATFETSSMGFDPSTGRTPVELANNAGYVVLSSTNATSVVKAAPGFLHAVSITVAGALATATHLALYDNTAASGTALLGMITLPAGGAPSVTVQLNELFTSGLSIAPVTLAAATGSPSNVAPTTGYSVLVTVAYR